jgi:hypothetical protein
MGFGDDKGGRCLASSRVNQMLLSVPSFHPAWRCYEAVQNRVALT